MARPRRLYYNEKTNKYYYLINGKKVFIKVPAGMSQKQAQTINIKNIIQGDARRLKPKKKRVKAKYTKKLDKGMEKLQPSPFSTGRPTFFFQPPSSTTILERNIAKSDDTATNKLLELLLKGAKENIQLPDKPNIPQPAVERQVKVEPPERTVKVEPPERKVKVEPPVPTETPLKNRSTVLVTRETDIKPTPPKETKNTETNVSLPPIKTSKAQRIPKTQVQKDLEEMRIQRFSQIVKDYGGEQVFDGTEGEKKNPLTYSDFDLGQIAANLGLEVRPSRTKETYIGRIINELLKSKGQGCDCKKKKDDDGLYNDEIEEIMQKRIKNYVPTVAQDKVHTLLQYVNPNDKYFAAVVNTEPSHSSGRHWRCIFIDNRDDFPSAEYFDPLAERSKPEPALLEVMRMIAKKMNPEKYFKFKFNKLQRQSNKTSNCGFHVMQFIEDRVNADDFETASGWKSYMKRKQQGKGIPDAIDGEKNVKPYQEMIEKKFSSYL